jgi:hypothetical protein
LQDMACITDTAPEQEDPMHSSLHSCTFGQKAPRRSLASLEVRGAAKPLTQVRKILMNPLGAVDEANTGDDGGRS